MRIKLCQYGTLAVLVLVAVHQFYQVQINHLSRWKGGGFGMYSEPTFRQQRTLNIYIEIDGKLELANLEQARGLLVAKKSVDVRILPSDERLNSLARELRKVKLAKYDYDGRQGFVHLTPTLAKVAKKKGINLTVIDIPRIYIEVLEIKFSSKTGLLTQLPLNSKTVAGK